MEKKELTQRLFLKDSLRMAGRAAVFVGLFLCCLAAKADAQAFRIEPSVVVSEEYNDNVFLHRSNTAEALITRFAPSVRVRYTTSFWDWELNYTYNYYYYYFPHKYDSAGVQVPDHDQTHGLSARNRTEFIKDLLFLEVRDEYSRVSQNIAVDYTQQSPRTNQVDQNIFTANPYVVLHPTSTTRTVFGYIFQETKYLNPSDDALATDVNRVDNIAYADAGIDLSSRLTFTASVRNTEEHNSQLSFNQLDVFAGPQYVYAEHGTAYARAGKTWFHFRTNPNTNQEVPSQEYWFWDAGISHRIATITLALGARRFVAQDPQRVATLQDQYTATIMKTMPRYVLTLGGGWYEYRDAVVDQRITTSKQVQGSFLYRLTPTTTSTLGGGFQDVDDLTQDGVTKILLATFRLEHQLSEKDTVSLQYGFVHSQSSTIEANNYSNNRCLLEYRRLF